MENKSTKGKHVFLTNDFTRRGLSLLLLFSFVATIIAFTVAYCEHKNYNELLTKYEESLERIGQCEESIAALMTSQANNYTTAYSDTTEPIATVPSDKKDDESDTFSDYQELTAIQQTSENEIISTTIAETPSGYYVTRSGKKYHIASCSHLSKSKIPISLERIKAERYSPCSRCIK